jgi:hypothetical protein
LTAYLHIFIYIKVLFRKGKAMKRVTALTFILLCCLMSMLAKPAFSIKLLNNFKTPDVHYDPSFTGYAVADSILMIFDTSDSTVTKTVCYDFAGKKVDVFQFPADSIYVQPIDICYLEESQQIAVSARHLNLVYYALDGTPVGIKKPMSEPLTMYLNALEFQGDKYYISYNVFEAYDEDVVTTSMTWFKETPDEMIPLRKRCVETERGIAHEGPFPWFFKMDGNKNRAMAMVEEMDNDYQVKHYNADEQKKFSIKRQKGDCLGNILTGVDYIYLHVWDKNFHETTTTGIYDLKGNKIYTLSKFDRVINRKKEQIIDIVDDKLITYNYKDNSIQIFEVKLTEK